jgi:hypothetical protein
MNRLIAMPEVARILGGGARRIAQQKFDLGRFTREWENTFRLAIDTKSVEYETHSIYQ